MQNRMKAALLAWCKAYETAVNLEGTAKKAAKDFFLAAYQQTVGDRFCDSLIQPEQETTDGRTLGEASRTNAPTFLSEHHCRDCRWFLKAIITVDAIKKGYTYERIDGFCRRHAPIRVEGSGITDLQWPNVLFNDCCGDWEDEWIDPPKLPDCLTPGPFTASSKDDGKVFNPMAFDDGTAGHVPNNDGKIEGAMKKEG